MTFRSKCVFDSVDIFKGSHSGCKKKSIYSFGCETGKDESQLLSLRSWFSTTKSWSLSALNRERVPVSLHFVYEWCKMMWKFHKRRGVATLGHFQFVEVKKELSQKVNLLIYCTAYISVFNCDINIWIIITRPQMDVAEISFFYEVNWVSFRDGMSCHLWGVLSGAALFLKFIVQKWNLNNCSV